MESTKIGTQKVEGNPFTEASAPVKEHSQWNPYDYHGGNVIGTKFYLQKFEIILLFMK